MSHFAAAVVRGRSGWTATELDLSDAADVEDVADRLRDVDLSASVSLLFVESDDSYLAVMRLDDGEDLRVFGSDSAFVDESRLGKLLLGDLTLGGTIEPALEPTDADDFAEDTETEEEERPAADPTVNPIGDADLLADLGVSAHHLLELCATDGLMPADVTAEITQIIGCADEVEELREA
ncbi:putative tRNA adenosine deaminase-associated protein [Hamadaea flava]|uniref:tRNA adenosine deaminase-associated protein n=1 Tax=Hamadaea flava TaxID=1742688 RepID=A0ABV8LG51_9ACTN|nr:tRNA adenosine deaminase-associated protein [Hamadaea flava]MCP2326194.1 putative tRNA adenosine deaminase-associated protein [Hamadaea flava]